MGLMPETTPGSFSARKRQQQESEANVIRLHFKICSNTAYAGAKVAVRLPRPATRAAGMAVEDTMRQCNMSAVQTSTPAAR